MDEEEHLHRFGTPLEPLEKDEVPAKRPITVEDQIVKDENGKRRFHGAFTGGFSAGFWNTVGSLEGWTPQNFKSSRGEKASKVQQRPEDFMDKEDLGEFGIAPQGIRTRDEFSKESEEQQAGKRKRKLMQSDLSGAIPGAPVLEQLLRPVRDKVAVRILKSMGWKQGQGVGPRQTRKEKRQATERNKKELYLLEHYGAESLSLNRAQTKADSDNNDDGDGDDDDDDDEDQDDEDITFAPDDYEPVFYTPKDNRFGMSYTGLSRAPVLSKGAGAAGSMQHINLFGQLEEAAKHKNLSIRGQAFGVGAFEEEDDDIYARDDMTSYDFSLGDKQPKKKKQQHVQQRHVIDGFSEDKSGASVQTAYAIDLPRDFEPRNWMQRRSRFAPMEAERARQLVKENEYKKAGLGRHDLNPEQRAKLLGEPTQETPVEQQQQQQKKNPFKSNTKTLLERIGAKHFTRGGLITSTGEEQKVEVPVSAEVRQENAVLMQQAAAKTKDLAAVLDTSQPQKGFKPFLANEAKQQRYEQFLAAKLKDDEDITKFLSNIQPVTLSLWEREMEKKEFIQAAKIYRPLAGLMDDRFVSEATVTSERAQEQAKPAEELKIVMERTTVMWKPNSVLCKRYNIAEPFGGALLDSEKELKKKPKMSIFDYLETSVNSKSNFQTPSIIPKHMEAPKLDKVATTVQHTNSLQEQQPKELEQELEKVVEKPSTAATPAATKPTFVPKTPLEQAVEASKNKPISEKTDLFKSIFDDSDEEEELKTEEQSAATNDDKVAAMQAALGLPGSSNSSATAANVLRNNSPPRGIFAALFKAPEAQEKVAIEAEKPKFAPIEGNKLKISYKPREERLKNDKTLDAEPAAELYGPKLPTEQPVQPAVIQSTDAHIDAKLQQLWQKHAPKKRKAEKWVERQLSSEDDSDDSDESSDSSDCEKEKIVLPAKKNKKSKSKKSHKKTNKKLKKHKEKDKFKKKKNKREKSPHKSKKSKSK